MLGTSGITYLGSFEMAELATDPAEREACLSFVVVGAGPTGVEVVGQIAELAHRVLPGDYREIDTRQARIVLIEAGPAVLVPSTSAFSGTPRGLSSGWVSKCGVPRWPPG